ncbi:integral membrane protein [Rhypophila sp. PSN 637]
MWGDFGCTIEEYRLRLGGVPPQEPVNAQSKLMLISFISIFCTTGCEVAARISIIFLYYRLFSVEVWLGRSLKAVAAFTILWFICVIFTVVFMCQPVAAIVDASIQGAKCMDAQLGFVITEGISLSLDLAVAILPIKTILSLHMPLKEKISIFLIFVTGGFVMITQILRMVFGYNPDPNSDRSVTSLAQLSVWTGLHLGFAIICACLPLFRVYFPKSRNWGGAAFGSGFFSSGGRWGSLLSSSTGTGKGRGFFSLFSNNSRTRTYHGQDLGQQMQDPARGSKPHLSGSDAPDKASQEIELVNYSDQFYTKV